MRFLCVPPLLVGDWRIGPLALHCSVKGYLLVPSACWQVNPQMYDDFLSCRTRLVSSCLQNGPRSQLFWLDFFLVFFWVSIFAVFSRKCDFPLKHVPIAFCNAEFGGFRSKCEKECWLKKKTKIALWDPSCGFSASRPYWSATGVLVRWHCIVAQKGIFFWSSLRVGRSIPKCTTMISR